MADDLIQSSMAGAQPVPSNFNAEEADNLEDVSTAQAAPRDAIWCDPSQCSVIVQAIHMTVLD